MEHPENAPEIEHMLVKPIGTVRFFCDWKLYLARVWVSFSLNLHQVEAERLELLKAMMLDQGSPIFYGSVLFEAQSLHG